MNILVTGGKGFIGSNIVKELLRLKHDVTVIDDESAISNSEFYEFENVKYVKKDITNFNDIEAHFRDIDYVFHLAARARIQPTLNNINDAFVNNVIGTQNVLEACRIHKVFGVIYSSSSSIYGTANQIPFSETMPANCLNPYSLSKYQGEQICNLYMRLYNVPVITLRYFNVYGPGEPLKGQYAPVIGKFKKQKRDVIPLTVVGTGEQTRDFTYIDDVVAANIKSLEYLDNDKNVSLSFEPYNIGTGVSFSINEITRMVADETYPITRLPPRPAEAQHTRANINKAMKELNWKPKHLLPDMINTY